MCARFSCESWRSRRACFNRSENFFTRCEDSIGCMHGSSEPDLRNWKSHLQTQPGRIQPIDSSQLAD
ncbi:hypothetical protein L564_0270 [Bordetella pertussis CHLA-15]|nr:hypothetical protein L564_0270 [Bordetella pertussis CHLA-15]